MFKSFWYAFLIVVGASVFSASWADAQVDDMGYVDDEYREALPERKSRSMFKRPNKKTPAEQLAYADSLSEEGRIRQASRQYRALVHRWHEATEAPLAQMRFARMLEKRGKHRSAFNEYQYLIDFFPGRFPYTEVLDRQFRIANLIMASRRWKLIFFQGFSLSEESIPFFERIVSNAPQWEKVPQIQFTIATIREESGDDEEAIAAYERITSNYPDSSCAADAAFRIGVCLYEEAMDRPRNEKALRNAIVAFNSFLKNHQGDDHVQVADEMHKELNRTLASLYYDRAVFYDKMKGKRKAAYIAYVDFIRRFPSSEFAAAATTRAEALKKEFADNEEQNK